MKDKKDLFDKQNPDFKSNLLKSLIYFHVTFPFTKLSSSDKRTHLS